MTTRSIHDNILLSRAQKSYIFTGLQMIGLNIVLYKLALRWSDASELHPKAVVMLRSHHIESDLPIQIKRVMVLIVPLCRFIEKLEIQADPCADRNTVIGQYPHAARADVLGDRIDASSPEPNMHIKG